MSFTGEFRHTIDAKGRLIVPARLRAELEDDHLVLTLWPDGCIAMWSGPGWRELESALKEQRRSDTNARSLVRALAAGAHQDTVDRQGRITVPPHLQEWAGVARDVVVAGALDHGEIWSPEKWAAQKSNFEAVRLEELARDLNF